ncbi:MULTISPECIES: hypothetical protein [unclassified Bradyrhizobium]|uniref:hypothetical protein n=1 Tax=unclassified Bradyrhizobium TaxID=2631580 RepID=UPI0028E55BA5|nr:MULTISPECIES: hypothetical protein [unclassified Bradyrhizobium]
MPAHDIAQANREKPGISGMDEVVAFDQSLSSEDFLKPVAENRTATPRGNDRQHSRATDRKKFKDFKD